MPPVETPEPTELEQQTSSAAPDLFPESSEKAGWVRKAIVLIVILAVVGFTVWKIRGNITEPVAPIEGKRGSGSGDRAVPVTTASVQKKRMPVYLAGLGTVTAYYSVTIKTRVDGQLIAVDVKEGQKVRKGQLLAEIDPAPYAAAVAQTEGQLAKDKATATYADVEAGRYTTLFNAGVISQDSQQLQVANAGQLAGALQADKAAIQAARVNLNYTRITSPIDGVVGLRQVDPGNIVHASDITGLLLITQLQPISVIFTLPEDDLPRLQHVHKDAKLSVEAYDRSQTTLLATGKLLSLDNQIDIATGTDKVKAVFENKDGNLFPNQFVNVRLILEQRPDALVIPASAIQTGSQGTFVFVLKKGDPPAKSDKLDTTGSKPEGDAGSGGKHHNKPADGTSPAPSAPAYGETGSGDKEKAAAKYYVEIRPIVVDVTEGSQAIVSSGLSAGDEVVIDGTEKLKNNSKVTPKQDGGKSGHKSSKGGDAAPDPKPAKSDDKTPSAADSGSPKTGEHHHHDHGQQQ